MISRCNPALYYIFPKALNAGIIIITFSELSNGAFNLEVLYKLSNATFNVEIRREFLSFKTDKFTARDKLCVITNGECKLDHALQTRTSSPFCFNRECYERRVCERAL